MFKLVDYVYVSQGLVDVHQTWVALTEILSSKLQSLEWALFLRIIHLVLSRLILTGEHLVMKLIKLAIILTLFAQACFL